jgi:phospholipase C
MTMTYRSLEIVALALSLVLIGCGGMATSNSSNSTNGNNNTPPAPPSPAPTADITSVNHIIYMMQENRSFDEYFGQLNAYRQSQGFGADVDVTPATASQLSFDKTTTFTPFHMVSMCAEELSSFWNESHNDWNHEDPTSATPRDGWFRELGWQ